ncbi:MAG TPA: phage BR0599 family protein [Leptospiraceae bacterium]|nr:phage BR0599 family protein [Leptospiraceae bacterium]
MPFIEIEQSTDDAYPVELYRFYSTAFEEDYFYTSADEDITYNGDTYKALERLQRSQPELTRENNAENLEIFLPRDNPLAKRWLTYVPPRTVWVTVYRYHRSESGIPQVAVFWQGKIRGASWSVNDVTLQGLPIDTAFSRNGLRVTFGKVCRHELYGSKCKVPLNAFLEEATLTQISRNKLYSPAFTTFPSNGQPVPNGWWIAGFIENPVTQEIRYITNHSGTEIEILAPFETLQVGDVVNIAAGCKHDPETCRVKFDNIVNYGGLTLYMGDNPYTIRIDQ